MDLVRDLLDKKVVDRNGREMGRVDSIVLDVRGNRPPRAVAIELGPAILFARVRPFLGRWVAALELAFGIGEGRPTRIAVTQIIDITDHVKVDVAIGETSAGSLERRLRSWLGAWLGSS